jgi:hypothetical protein
VAIVKRASAIKIYKYYCRLKKPITIFSSLFIVSTIYSCVQKEICSQATEPIISIGFYSQKNGEIEDTLLFDLTAKGINRPDTLPDSLPYKNVKNIKNIKLPLAPDKDQCSFILDFDSVPEIIRGTDTTTVYHSFIDTIHFSYSRQLKLLSPECGFTMDLNLKLPIYSRNAIDSIVVVQPNIQAGNEENVKIFL